jgi:hypothetical protein
MLFLAIQPIKWLREPPQHWSSRHPLWQDVASLCARISPAVYVQGDYWVIDTTPVQRMHGGCSAVVHKLMVAGRPLVQCLAGIGCGPTVAQAIARLQLWATQQPTAQAGQQLERAELLAVDTPAPESLPIALLPPWQQHIKTVHALGWYTWGDLRRVPPAQAARRFGQAAVHALAQAFGDAAHGLSQLPNGLKFDQTTELPALASDVAQLQEPAQQLLCDLCANLAQHHMAATVVQWVWHFEPSLQASSAGLASEQRMRLQASQASADVHVWQRLTHAHWEHQCLDRPVAALSLVLLAHQAQHYAEPDLLAQPHTKAATYASSTWAVCLDHIQAKLGNDAVRVMQLHNELTPELQCSWEAYTPQHGQQLAAVRAGAKSKRRQTTSRKAWPSTVSTQVVEQQPVQHQDQLLHAAQVQSWQGLRPTWLLKPALRLVVKNHLPHYGSELRLLMGPERLELVAWHSLEREQAVVRDYYVAWGEQCGLVWVFKTKAVMAQQSGAASVASADWVWYLHGFYG